MRVAVDVTPLLGAPTGVSQSLRGLLGGLADGRTDVEVVPFVLSARAAGGGPVVVHGRPAIALPLPAGLAIRAWGRIDRPRADRWLGSAAVVHGSNFVVPPMRRRPTTTTIHDCWCARHPERCSADVAAMTAAVRRAVARGAWLHVTTEHGAREVAEVYGATERVAVVPFAVPTVGVPGRAGEGGDGGDPAFGGGPGGAARPVTVGDLGDADGGPGQGVRRVADGGARVDGARGPVGSGLEDVVGTVDEVGAGVPPVVAGRPSILALGATDPRKGLPGLVRAFGALAAADAEVVLVLAGPDGPGRPEVDAALADLPPGVARRVHVLGAVSDPVRRSLLAGATVLAYPSLDEGFGFPVLEAMAAGVPVVASSAGALPEVAGDAAVLVPVGDDDALAAALTAVLADDRRRAEHVIAGRARAATFTWARTAAGMADLWRRAVTAGP